MKFKIALLLILVFGLKLNLQAQTVGIKIATPIIKNNPADNTTTGYANLLNGGLHTGPTYHSRDSLSTYYSTTLYNGMLFHVYGGGIDSTYVWTGSAWTPALGGSGTTTNPLTVNNSGTGNASPFTFDGNTAKTISYNSIGAYPLTGNPSNFATSISLTTPFIFSSPVTWSIASGAATATLSLSTQANNLFFAGPATAGSASPTFRSIVTADLPTTAVTPGSYTNLNATIDATGRIVAAANGTSAASFYAIGQYATTTALLSNTYNNGTAGIGATLIGNVNGAIVLDGATPTTGQLVLVWNEATQSHNGIYDVTQVGDASHPYILTRDANSNTPGSLVAGSQFYTQLGTNYTGITFTQTTTGTITIGTTNLVYTGNGSTFLTNTLLGTGTTIDPFTINPLGPGFSVTPTAFNVMVRDGNANSFVNNLGEGYQQIVTSASTTTFLASSPHTTSFTGTTTQTGLLPVVSGLTVGHIVKIEDNSTGVVTIQSSGANTVQALAAGTSAVFTFNGTAGTGAASWDVNYSVSGVSSISIASANGFTGSSSGGSTPALTLSLQNATTAQSGQLTSTDWNTFNAKQAAGSYLTAIGVTTANGISGTSSGGTTPNLTLTLGNITPTTVSTTIKPATIYQTPLGTAGTDSVMVKHSGGTVSAIPANYYSTGGGGISGLTTNYISKASSSTTIANSLLYDDGTGVMLGTTLNAGYGFDNAGTGRVQGNFAQGIITLTVTPTATPFTSGGTLVAGTYYYKVCPKDAAGNVGTPSPEVSAVITTSTGRNVIAWTSSGSAWNASSYRIFRGTSSNGENVYYDTSLGADQTSFSDVNGTSTAGSPPTVNSTSTLLVQNPTVGSPSLLISGPNAALQSQTSRYNGKYTNSLGSWLNATSQLVLGGDGTNYVQFGTTDAGGYGEIWTNCSNAFGAAPNGNKAAAFNAAGTVNFFKEVLLTPNASGVALALQNTVTSTIFQTFSNNGALGGNLQFGVASSTGTGFTASLSNYASALFTGNATDLFFGTNQLARMSIFSGGRIAVNTITDNTVDQFQVNGTISSGVVATSTGGLKLSGITAGTISVLPQANGGTYNFNLPTTAGTSGQDLTSQGGGSTAMIWTSKVYGHTIFTPATGGTVNLVNNQTNVINPSGTLATLTVNLPSSPANDDRVFIKYTQAITAVTYGNGTVVDGITAPTAGGLVVLIYDSGTTSWY